MTMEFTDTGTEFPGGQRWTYTFDNGYGASVIRNQVSYGGDQGLFEVAVLHGDTLCYATPITDDVEGRLNFREVGELLEKIAWLAERPYCSHQREAP